MRDDLRHKVFNAVRALAYPIPDFERVTVEAVAPDESDEPDSLSAFFTEDAPEDLRSERCVFSPQEVRDSTEQEIAAKLERWYYDRAP